MAVELRPLRRQDEEAQVALSACVLELGPELRPAIDLDALDAEGDLGDELVEEGCGAARGCAAGDEGDGPLRRRVVSHAAPTIKLPLRVGLAAPQASAQWFLALALTRAALRPSPRQWLFGCALLL